MCNHQPPRRIVEIRSYNLKPGTRDRFHQLAVEAGRLLARANIDVLAHGPSPHDSTTYFLIRAFDGLEDRQRREDEFYGGAAWREGPRDQVLALIESYTTIVLDLDAATVESLRAADRVTGR
jgi:hypothetical protein